MTFKQYYGDPFRADIAKVILSGPPSHSERGEVAIQPRTLSTMNPVIRSWDQEHIDLFVTAPFFTVLVDQVCYTYYREYYSQFQSLTRYPKFRGDCTGGCSHHIHPKYVFKVIASPPGPYSSWSGTANFLEESIDVMHSEVTDFFGVHLKVSDGLNFWSRCVDEIRETNEILAKRKAATDSSS